MSGFRTIPQPGDRRPHVEIQSPAVRSRALPDLKENAFSLGVGELTKAMAQRQLEQDKAAAAADPWNGLRTVPAASPLAGFGDRLRGLFNPGS